MTEISTIVVATLAVVLPFVLLIGGPLAATWLVGKVRNR